MIVSTTMDVPGREIAEILGMVHGNSVRARAVGRDIVASLRNLVGGEIPEYAELLVASRQQALDRMLVSAEELGADRDVVLGYTGAPVTKMRISYCDWVSRTKPWLEAFAAIAGNEVARGKAMIERVGERARTSRRTFESLGLSEKALAHWDAAEQADAGEGGHGDAPLDFLDKYAVTQEAQDACLAAMRERQEVNRIWSDQVGVWAFEASDLTPPSIDKRQPRPEPVLAA